MRETGERRSATAAPTREDSAMDALHRYPYGLARGWVKGGRNVLEVGFGDGYGAALLRPERGTYEGIEVAREAVPHAEGRYGDETTTFRLYDGTTIPFPDETFSLVLSFQVIEHVADVERYLRELRRVTAPGGRIALTTPNRLYRVGEGERPWNRFHLREYSPDEFLRAVEPVFPGVEIFGIAGTDELNEVERTRVLRLRKLARLDPFGLRYVLPERITRPILQIANRRSRSEQPGPLFDLSDVRHGREGLDDSLHLLGVIDVA